MSEARLLAYLLALLAVVGGGAYAGWTARDWKAAADERAERRAEALVAQAREQAALGAADAIAKIEVRNVTIRQQTERELVDRPVYRDCVASDSVLALTNAAITGAVQGAGGGGVPGAGAHDGGDVR